MLSPMDHPTDFFTIVPTDVALMTLTSLEILSDGNSSWTLGNRKHCTPSDLLARGFSLVLQMTPLHARYCACRAISDRSTMGSLHIEEGPRHAHHGSTSSPAGIHHRA